MKKNKLAGMKPFSLEDQDFLKALGISGMPEGMEYALREQKIGKESHESIEARAEGLEALDLNTETLELLSKETGRSVAELTKDVQFFDDLKKLPGGKEGSGEA